MFVGQFHSGNFQRVVYKSRPYTIRLTPQIGNFGSIGELSSFHVPSFKQRAVEVKSQLSTECTGVIDCFSGGENFDRSSVTRRLAAPIMDR